MLACKSLTIASDGCPGEMPTKFGSLTFTKIKITNCSRGISLCLLNSDTLTEPKFDNSIHFCLIPENENRL